MKKIYFIVAIGMVLTAGQLSFAQNDPASAADLNAAVDSSNEEMLNDEGYGQDDVEYYGAEDDLNAEINADEDTEQDVEINSEAGQ